MKSFWRERTVRCGKNFKDVDIFLYSGNRQEAAGRKRSPKKKVSAPKQQNLNDERSKRYFMQLAKMNFVPGDLHITLTYTDENMPESREEAEKNARNYMRRISYHRKKRGLPPVKYIIITSEYSADGEPARLHHHIFMSADDRDLTESLWRLPKNKGGDPIGTANADRIQDVGNSINKLVAYIAKQTSGKKRYISSHNLLKPTCENNDFKYTPYEMHKIIENYLYDVNFWERKYKGWKIMDSDYDLVVKYNELSGYYISLRFKRYTKDKKTRKDRC